MWIFLVRIHSGVLVGLGKFRLGEQSTSNGDGGGCGEGDGGEVGRRGERGERGEWRW